MKAAARIVVAALVSAHATPTFAYLKFGTTANGQTVTVRWGTMPVRYYVTDAGVPGVSATDLQGAAGRAFAQWEAVPTASISYQFAGFTSALPGQDDGQSTLGFQRRPDLARVLAATSFLLDNSTGELIESDIFFNSAFPWSTAAAGETGKFDLESIALHEIGHFSGLGHSALGETELRSDGTRRVTSSEATMFPIAFAAGSTAGRTLRADDIAGISDIYPAGDAETGYGSISGTVTRSGQGLFGAHVIAFDLETGKMVAGFSLNSQGRFVIARLSPGPHVIRVEPLDDADVDSFFSAAAGVDVNLRVAFYERVVVVPRGGDAPDVNVTVVAK